LNSTSSSKPWRFLRSRRIAVAACLLALFAFVGGETVARLVLGLGDPPLYLADPKIEYLNKPGHYHRFGHNIHINAWSMRSPDFPEKKASSNELRILVIGDSVVNGGARIDDSQTATAQLASSLAKATGRPVVVANISAGSWGPQNQLEYLKRFGTFDADAAIVVWSSHDAWDVPGFGPFGVDLPTEKPMLALDELVRRYALAKLFPPPSESPPHTQQDVDQGIASAKELLQLLRSKRIPVAVVIHKTQTELKGKDLEGDKLLAAVAESADDAVFQTEAVLRPAVEKGESVFFDDIHPNPSGNALLADLYLKIVMKLLAGSESGAAPSKTS